MINPYRYAQDASAYVKITLYECMQCGNDFEPLAPWDLYCDECWDAISEAQELETSEQ